jgi:hypothetical protein
MEEDRVLSRGRVTQRSELDLDTGIAKPIPSTGRQRIRIPQGDDDPADPRLNDGLGARGLLALMRAGLEGHDHRRASSPFPCTSQRYRFGMPLPKLGMPAFADCFTALQYHRAH